MKQGNNMRRSGFKLCLQYECIFLVNKGQGILPYGHQKKGSWTLKSFFGHNKLKDPKCFEYVCAKAAL